MLEIVLECNPDEALVKSLGFTRKQVTHQPNKGSVFNYLEKNPSCVGIVDEDPGSAAPGHFAKYKKQGDTRFDIDVYSYPNRQTRLLVLKPRLEEWILKHAEGNGVRVTNYSLPQNGHQLHKVINERISKFEALLNELVDSEPLQYLKSLISAGNNHH